MPIERYDIYHLFVGKHKKFNKSSAGKDAGKIGALVHCFWQKKLRLNQESWLGWE